MLIDEYKQMLYARYLEVQDLIINLYQDNVLGENAIDRIIEGASKSIQNNFSKTAWRPGAVYCDLMRIPDKTYDENVAYLRAWLERPNKWLLKHWGLTSKVQPKLKDSSYKYNDLYLTGFSPKTSVLKLKDIFSETVSINTVGEFIATGDVIRGKSASYYAVVGGDVNGDSKVDPVDYILLKQTLAKKHSLTGAYYQAACLGEKKPTEENCQKIKQLFLTGTCK
jgi:hypothetical protein